MFTVALIKQIVIWEPEFFTESAMPGPSSHGHSADYVELIASVMQRPTNGVVRVLCSKNRNGRNPLALPVDLLNHSTSIIRIAKAPFRANTNPFNNENK